MRFVLFGGIVATPRPRRRGAPEVPAYPAAVAFAKAALRSKNNVWLMIAFYGVGPERLGDQKGWFGPFPGQQPLRVSSDEHDRDLTQGQNVIHRVEAGAAVGQLDVRQHKAGGTARDRAADGLLVRMGDMQHGMAKGR